MLLHPAYVIEAFRALDYTGALKLAHKVQQRTLRATNIDSHTCQPLTSKCGAMDCSLASCWMRHGIPICMSVIFVVCDDKCKVLPLPFPNCSKVNVYFGIYMYLINTDPLM